MSITDVLRDRYHGESDHLTVDPETGRGLAFAVKVPPELEGLSDADRLVACSLLTLEAVKGVSKVAADYSRIVDEYLTQTLAPETVTQILLTPQFQKLNIRVKHIIISGPSQGTPARAQGSVTSPGAGATVCIINLPSLFPGTYTVSWSVDLDGTVGAGDANNFQISGAGAGTTVSENNGAIGHYVQTPFQLTLVPGFSTGLKVTAIAAGTVGAIYSAQLILTPVPGSFPVTLQLGDRVFNLVIPATGVLEMSPECMLLSPQDARILTATIAGEYTLEIMGFADVRY